MLFSQIELCFVCFAFGRDGPQCATTSSSMRLLDHTQRRTTVGRTPLDEWAARRRDLYLTTHTTFTTDKHPCPPVGFFNQHSFILVHCVHSSTHVTATVSIVSEVRVFIGQGTVLLPHTTVPFGPPLSRTVYSYTSHTFPCLLTSQCTRVQSWHTLRPVYNTESHPFLHLMGQWPLLLLCFHATTFHARHSHGSTSVPLLPLPKQCNKIHPDATAPRCVPLVGSWS